MRTYGLFDPVGGHVHMCPVTSCSGSEGGCFSVAGVAEPVTEWFRVQKRQTKHLPAMFFFLSIGCELVFH